MEKKEVEPDKISILVLSSLTSRICDIGKISYIKNRPRKVINKPQNKQHGTPQTQDPPEKVLHGRSWRRTSLDAF